MICALMSAGFNIEVMNLTDLDLIGELLLMMIAFAWCYDISEHVHHNIKKISVKNHDQSSESIFRYGLDIVTEFLVER